MPKITPLPTPTEWDLAHLESCDSCVRVRRLLELAIVRKACAELIESGDRIRVCTGDDATSMEKPTKDIDAIMALAFSVDECTLYVHKSNGRSAWGFIELSLGSLGYDVIHDFDVYMRPRIELTLEYAVKMADWA